MSNLYNVSSTPHIRGKMSTQLIMLIVVISLLPACGFGVYNFGLRALFVLLFSVNYTLKRRIKIRRLFLGSIVGSISTISLFVPLKSFELFLLKFIISIFMILSSFSYKNILYFLKNLFYLYIVSIFLGGTLYLLNIQFSYKNNGIIFYHNGLSINIILVIIITPIIIYIFREFFSIFAEKANIWLYSHQKFISENESLSLLLEY